MNEEELKNLVREEIRNYFRQSFPGFEMVSNNDTVGHGAGEFCLTTDSAQGFHFYKQGNLKINSHKSFETYTGRNATNKDTTLGFYAENGHIYLHAINGDLILQGTNVKIEATGTKGSVSVTAPKNVYTKSAEVQTEATKVNLSASSTVEVMGGFCSIHAEAGPVEVSGGDDEVLNEDFITQIINFIEKTKKFFKSVCGGE